MIAVDAILTAVEGRLKETFTKAEAAVERWPDKPEDWRSTHQNATLLVTFAQADPDTVEDIGRSAQSREVEIVIYVCARTLKANSGGPALMDRVQQALFGFRPAGSGKLTLGKAQWHRREGADHRYLVSFKTKHLVLERSVADPAPMLARVSSCDDAGMVIDTGDDQ